MYILAISNHKGWVGKTTSTVNIGAALVRKGYKVLLIDLDPQANLTQSFNITKDAFTIYDYIKTPTNIIPIQTKPGLFVIPSSLDLSAAEVEISLEPGREYILKDIISKITINELREVDSINLTINDKLVDYISKEEGVSIKDAPSSFMLRNIGIKTLNLDIAI